MQAGVLVLRRLGLRATGRGGQAAVALDGGTFSYRGVGGMCRNKLRLLGRRAEARPLETTPSF